jgi:hypothetical protein
MTGNVIPFQREQSLKPSRPLGKHGLALWDSVVSEYGIEDSGGVELLTLACQSLDRAEACAVEIKRTGLMLKTKIGPKENPLIKHELAARAFTARTLQKLGLDVEAVRPVGRPAGSFRTAGDD